MISGEPGIGKTHLAQQFGSRAEAAGVFVLHGRCREEDGAPSFWPWIQIVRACCLDSRALELAERLAREAPEIAQSVPGLATASGPYGHGLLPPANARFRLFDSMTRFIEDLSRFSPLAIILDDVHRADKPSLLLLDFLLREASRARLLVVATHRSLELSREPDRLSLLSEVQRRVRGNSITLGGLSDPEIEQLVQDLAGWSPSAGQTHELGRLTGGNPFFLCQLATILRRTDIESKIDIRDLPLSVRDAVARQLDVIDRQSRRALEAACVIGRDFESWLVARSAGLAQDEAARALGESVDAGILRAVAREAGTFRFVHALVREVLYQQLSPSSRIELHEAVADALLGVAVVDPGRLAELAHHLFESATPERVGTALDVLCEVAERASDGLAYEEAIEHYGRALTLIDRYLAGDHEKRCEVLLRLGAEEVRCGDRPSASPRPRFRLLLVFSRSRQVFVMSF